MKLLTFNISLSEDNVSDVTRIIQKENPDIICLQEVTSALDDNVHTQFNKKPKLINILSKSYRDFFYGPIFETYPYTLNGNYVDLGGLLQQGNLVFSKYPTISAENIFYYRNYEQVKDMENFLTREVPRAFQLIKLDINGKELKLINNHGIYTESRLGDERTVKECEMIQEYAKNDALPTIICGDFNLTPDSPSIKILFDEFKEMVTSSNIKSTDSKDMKIIDYIFVSEDINSKEVRTVDIDISFHYPIVYEFEI